MCEKDDDQLRLHKHINVMDMNVEKGEPIINYNHDFKFAPLKVFYNHPTYGSMWGPINFN